MSVQFKDYYQVLGVDRNASDKDVQRAFRAKARKVHPDVNRAPDAEDRFKELQEAYEVLKDPDKRERYDRLGANWEHGDAFEPPPARGGGAWSANSAPGGFENVDFSEFFSSMFGGRPSGFGGGPSMPVRGRDHEVELTLTLEELANGGTKSVRLAREERDSRGQQSVDSKTYDVKIPPGITSDSRIRLTGQGGAGAGEGPAGDLYFIVRVAPDPRFRVDGFDLRTHVEVTPWEAVLGATVSIPGLGGVLELKIPEGSKSGQTMRLRKQGLRRDDGESGDLLASIRIVVPENLTAADRELFEQLQAASTFTPTERCKAT